MTKGNLSVVVSGVVMFRVLDRQAWIGRPGSQT
jgi:hypothetical protein